MGAAVTPGFATSAFLVAVRLLIKDFFWIAILGSSKDSLDFDLERRLATSTSVAKLSVATQIEWDYAESDSYAVLPASNPFPTNCSGRERLIINRPSFNY
jgi:hypothetical protein